MTLPRTIFTLLILDISAHYGIEQTSDGHVLSFIVLGRTDLDGDSRGYRSAEEQARELTRSIRREVGKLSDKWNALIDRSDQWRRRLDETLAVSLFYF